MTINESINTQSEISHLRRLVKEIERTGRDQLKLKYFKAELKFYEEINDKSGATCVRNARLSEIEKLRADRETWEGALLSGCHKERELAYERIEAINSAISLISSFL